MDRQERPKSREKKITEGGTGVHKRGGGLHMDAPVGSADGYSGRGGSDLGSGSQKGSGGGTRNSGTRGRLPGLLGIIVVIVGLVFGGGSFLGGGLSGNSGGEAAGGGSNTETPAGNLSLGGGHTQTVDTSVASGSREKRTVIKGNGQDTNTIMVYMCGTDLESKNGMATSDLQEMMDAAISDQVNVIVYTGGCVGWRNQVVSSQVNQIYQVKNGALVCLVEDGGTASMTKPETLTEFIRWCKEHYPANRNQLIFWDHGGGSVSGYGYDQKYPRTGSMSLAGINQALKEAGVTFDFIGFDACLMATMETGLMLSQYGDYMIASEETEPGYGWYYTDWLTKLSQNPSMATLDIGKQIADDFVRVCAQKGQGNNTTLSLVDLAELETTGPEALAAFSRSASKMIQEEQYQTVSNARSNTKEFARSSGIDQVDLIHLAENMGNEEGRNLAEVLRSAVKYNRTSPAIANAYGISIYFPYKKVSSVDHMVQTYEQIGMDEEYSRCIQEFASLEVAGQAAAGGTQSPLPTLLGSLSGGSAASEDMINQLLGALLSGGYSGITGLSGSNTGFLSGRSLEKAAEYVAANQFDAGKLLWETVDDGKRILHLEEDQWGLIQNLELNVFYDDGGGYIDLGLDNVFEFDDNGDLIGDYDRTWIAINGQVVAYYFLEETNEGESYTITGRVPAMLNNERVDLILVFDNENPYGAVAGANVVYEAGETQTMAKGLTELKQGDQIDFLCDYYGYDGTFSDSYYLGEPMIVGDELEISNVSVGDGKVQATYRLTDIYCQHYWTPVME